MLGEFKIFERDQVAWAGYLMEGRKMDEEMADRARLFVQEGLEIMFAVEEARLEVDRVTAV